MQLLFNFYDDVYSNNLGIQPCGKYNGEGLVYTGAKRTIADLIYHAIQNTLIQNNIKNKNRFVDLFAGGAVCHFVH